MYPKKAPFPGASLVAGLLALGLAGAAQAASYKVRPEVDVEQTLDDNVLSGENEAGDGGPSNELSSWNTRMAPSVTLERKSDTSEASLLLGLTRHKMWSFSELDGTDEQLGASVRRALTPRLSMGARAHYQYYASFNAIEQDLVNGSPQILFGERPELVDRGLASDLRYVLDDTTELTGEVEWNALEYGRSTRSDLFDNEDRSLSLTLTRQLTAHDKAGVSLGLSFSEEENAESGFRETASPLVFRSLSTRNRDKLGTGLLFWERTWSPRWTTALQAGARTLESEIDAQTGQLDLFGGCPVPLTPQGYCPTTTNFPTQSDSGTGFVGGMSVRHAYSDRGQLSLSYSRDTRTGTSGSTGASSVDTDSFSAALAHRLAARVTMTLQGSYLLYEATGETIQAGLDAGSKTQLRSAVLRLDWQVRKNLTAYTSFNYTDVDQDRPLSLSDPKREYARRIFGFGVRYSFDHEL